MMKKKTVIVLTLLLIISALPLSVVADQTKIPVIIMFKQNQNLNIIKSMGGQIKTVYRYQPALSAIIPEKALEALERNPAIDFVVQDLPIEAVSQSTPWGVDRIGAPIVHASGNIGTGVNVAILDSGIDTDHPDLSFVYGQDFGNDDLNPEDHDGHGTHVAGTIAALDNNQGVIGVASGADLYILKIFKDDGSGYYGDAIEAIEWCIGTYDDDIPDNEIQVVSMSWGSTGDPNIESWINLAHSKGILLVAAAGNEGNPPGKGDNVIYPARYENVIAVAATDDTDSRARWSSTGPEVEISAPGVSISSTYLNGGYASASGTSMACPHVSATVALILSSDETHWASSYTNGDSVWTNDEVRAVLINTADDLGTTGRDEKYGYGLVDADEAAGTSEPSPPPPPPSGSKLIVQEISMAIGTKKAGPNDFVWAIATVTVVDESGSPVEGATVYGQWSGATTDTDEGVTDINGQVSLTSDSVKNPSRGTEFIFNVKDVTFNDWEYDANASSETSDSITYQ